ncbi:tetratricopeptide repeat protein [Stackebrandtia soli]|uniref:tetratricopeptide repeat protein n=1 Tax=Stackebrandtia soli TaxID=1892856 RepID=UPI0039EAB9FE
MTDRDDAAAWGRLLRAHRLRAGMSQEQLARVSGVSVRGIRMIENGDRRPRASTVTALAKAMRLPEADGVALLEAAQPQARTDAASESSAAVRSAVVPRQLPPAIAGFVGRETELSALDRLLTPDAAGAALGTITGPAGVGKTTLAVLWGHRVAAHFPDGQIYIDLQGFSPTGKVVTPAEVVRTLLDTLGVRPAQLPHSPAGQLGLYRSLVADKRILMILDNARDTAQTRPLLPGGTGCVTVLTSRDQLTGLVATEAASPVVLDVMTAAEARQLLARRIGHDQVLLEPEAAGDIIASCAHLPLALALVAARAAVHPGFRLSALAAELRDAHRGLTALLGVHSATDVQAVFSWSYRAVSADAARLFRLLALHHGPELSVRAAAALTATSLRKAASLLTELARANLLIEDSTNRYRFHDLLRAYAFDLAVEHDSDDARDAANHRLLDHYLHTALAAERLINPQRIPIDIEAPTPDSVPYSPTKRAQALTWFTQEHRNLCATVQRAHDGYDKHTWQLAWAMTTYLAAGFWSEWILILETGLAATDRADDKHAHNRIHLALGNAHIRVGNMDEARRHLTTALKRGQPRSQANAHLALAFCAEQQGESALALVHSEKALQLFTEVDFPVGQAKALNSIGWHRAKLGDYDHALSDCQRALTLLHELGEPHGEAETWDSLGYIHHHLRDFDEAVTSYRHALELHTEFGNTHNLAKVYLNLAETHQAMKDVPAVRDDLGRALSLMEKLEHPDTEHVRERLRLLGPR